MTESSSAPPSNKASPKSLPRSPRTPEKRATPPHEEGFAGSSIASADPPIEPAAEDDPVDDDEFDTFDASSRDTTSATSSVFAHTFENGRRYQFFKNARYPLPNDDFEQDREDMKHAMFMELMDGQLFYAPLSREPQLILDIGTGTGIWAMDVGDRYSSARVVGIDLTPIQPVWTPPNVEFIVDDCEEDWLIRDVDLAHFRFMVIVLRNVPKVLDNAYKSLRPGGWIELQELHGTPLCDDGTMKEDDPVKKVYDLAGEAFTKFGLDVKITARLEPLLLKAGFQNIHCKVKKVPIGPWAKGPTMRLIGEYQRTAVREIASTFAGRPFKALGMSDVESQVTLAMARRGLEDLSVHRYFNYYFWYAQKPMVATY